MSKKEDKIQYKLFHIDVEYYTFISGALICIPITLLFEVADNYKEPSFWMALVLSMAAGFFCFKLSIILRDVNETYRSNRTGVGNIVLSWNSAISEKKTSCIIYFSLTVLLFVLAIICLFLMQFIDSTAAVCA